jgi:lysophospholipase L1-like esterase
MPESASPAFPDLLPHPGPEEPVKAFASLLALLGLTALATAAEPFALKDGDRVVLIGSTLIEREQRYGYWESALTTPGSADQKIIFRNLGWSGDTVFGTARAGFGNVADGFRHLKEHVLSLKPTVIIVGYGTNEAFDGAEGLPKFVDGLNGLLDALAPTKARIVLLSPPRQEDLGRPLHDPTEHNKDLALYRDAIRKVAAKRGCRFVDLYDLLGEAKKPVPLTDNGMHLTAYGYWKSAAVLRRGLVWADAPAWQVEIDATGGKKPIFYSCFVEKFETNPVRFQVVKSGLPSPPLPKDCPAGATWESERLLLVRGLPAGKYELKIDGKPIVTKDAGEWASGVQVSAGPEFEQAERLREAIVAKNRLYFHRWRPQNETYLFGFRKHEQGQNAREIPQFDPLVEKAEAEINELKKPKAHAYELKRVEEEKK